MFKFVQLKQSGCFCKPVGHRTHYVFRFFKKVVICLISVLVIMITTLSSVIMNHYHPADRGKLPGHE